MKRQHILNRSGIAWRLGLIALGCALPIAVPVLFMVRGIDATIAFAQMERYGNAYQRALESLLKAVPEYDWAAQRAMANEPDRAGAMAALANQQARIDGLVSQLEIVDRRLGTTLQFTEQELKRLGREESSAPQLASQWQLVKAGAAGHNSQELLHSQVRLLKNIRAAISHAGDKSNLILNPDLDSYYLMDITLLALPQSQDRLATTIRDGQELLQRGRLAAEDRVRLEVDAAQLKESALDRIASSAQTALKEDDRFYGRSESLQAVLMPALQNYSEATNSFIELVRQVARAETVTVRPEEFLRVGQQAREASFGFWDIAAGELDGLLEQRIAWHQDRKHGYLLLSVLAVLSAFVLAWWNARSILGPVGALNGLRDRGDVAYGNGRDELSQEAAGFGRMIEGAAMMKEDRQSGVPRSGGAADMSADMEQQAGGAVEQSSTVMEVTMAVEDLARTATRISSAAQPLAHSVVATLEGMHAISDKMDAMAKRLVLLGEKSQAIGKVTGLIDDLTDQANLLALNGAIEAARAGEAGRAFAVVAAEFRALAERSDESTQDIRNLIIEIQTDTNASILEAQEAAMAATEGLAQVTQMTKVIQEVSLATLQQKSAADQVVLAIHKVDETAMQF